MPHVRDSLLGWGEGEGGRDRERERERARICVGKDQVNRNGALPGTQRWGGSVSSI